MTVYKIILHVYWMRRVREPPPKQLALKFPFKAVGFIIHNNTPAYLMLISTKAYGHIFQLFGVLFVLIPGAGGKQICQTWNILQKSFILLKEFLALG